MDLFRKGRFLKFAKNNTVATEIMIRMDKDAYYKKLKAEQE
jgi:hypothetical protein